TFIGSIYSDFGLKNIADAAGAAATTGYPQLTNEMVVQQNPGLIFLGDASYGESLATVSSRPGWGAIDAVAKARVTMLDADIASRWGPRVVDLYQSIAAGIPSIM
ncbi:MAG: ABC transporter substrate-binding protein, partial [Actinobacteria bacterium]|nr:ABC transporter substrate-binding protein [Actinomycetota bacterium]